MEYTDPTTTGSTIDPSSSSRLAASLPTAVKGPCAACKILRRRCTDKGMLAPYFPPTETLKFIIAHKVFGASNIVKSLQVIPYTISHMWTICGACLPPISSTYSGCCLCLGNRPFLSISTFYFYLMTFRSRFDNAWLADTTIDLAPSACHRPFHTEKNLQ